MCGHKQIGIWEVSKITVVDSNVVNHWLMTGVINIPTMLLSTTVIFDADLFMPTHSLHS